MRIAVIGAGPAGLTAACQLAKQLGPSDELDVYEAGPRVGGLATSLELWGQRVDLGPHRFFSTDPRVNRFWLEAAGTDYRMVERLTRVYYRGRFFHYPLRPMNALAQLGPAEATRCLLSYAREFAQSTPISNDFEQWVVHRFGRRLFRHFFKSYTEKLWGLPTAELDADFAAQRIKGFSLSAAVRDALLGGGSGRHKTLVDQFAYPTGGTGSIYERIAETVQARGGRLHLQTPVEQVVAEGGKVTGLRTSESENILPVDHVISSMPLTHLLRSLPGLPAEAREAAANLRFRNTILVYLKAGHSALFPDQWLYIHSPELRVGRITNFRNWVPELHRGQPQSILALEFWCNFEDAIWQWPEEDLIELARNELAATGLARADQVSEGHVHRIPRCYPVYFRGYRETLAPIVQHLRGISGLEVIGRYGAYKYNNQDHSILMGLLAAENVLQGAGHDTWGVNTDYAYQEASRITATGLVHG